MPFMEIGNDIHLERITGGQSSVPQLDTTNGELLAQVGPTASNIAEGNLSTHEFWPLKHTFTSTITVLEGTVFRVTVIRYNHGLTIRMNDFLWIWYY